MLAVYLLAALGAAPAEGARAAAVRSAATITSCKGERIGLAYSLRGGPETRGATLRVSAVLYPLFGSPRPAGKLDAGRKSKLVRSVGFDGLEADTWSAIVRYRWTRGRRTVAFGSVRTSSARVGRRRGRAFCTLPIGRPPVDTTPPFVILLPDTAEWLRGPVDLSFLAFDDLSGIRGVFSSVDGGAPVAGRTRRLATEGVHVVDYAARDVAGNTSPLKRGTVRVDTAPPTAPGLTRPAAVTGSVRPTVSWSASTDTGSGVRAYVVAIRTPAGDLVSSKRVGAGTLSTTIDDTLAPGAYTAEVYAVDGTTPEPYATGSGQRAFEVRPGPPQVTGTTPGGGEIIPKANDAASLSVVFDRPMDPGSVQAAVTLHRIAPDAGQIASALSCDANCTTATLDPGATLSEGVYELRTSTAARSEERVALAAAHTARFSVPIYEEGFEGGGCGDAGAFSTAAPWACRGPGGLPSRHLGAAGLEVNRPQIPPDRDAVSPVAEMDASAPAPVEARFTRAFNKGANTCPADAAQADVLIGANEDPARRKIYDETTPAGVQTIDFNLSGGNQQIRLRFRLHVDSCRTGAAENLSFSVDDLRIARKP